MRLFITGIFFLIVSLAQSQIYDPVSFKPDVQKIDDTHYALSIHASIEPGWHLYAQNVPDGGPVPTQFEFTTSDAYELNGSVSEPQGHVVDDPIFEMRIKYFSDSAEFQQVIERKTAEAFSVKASVEFMVCNDESCLPPTIKEVVFELEATAATLNEEATKPLQKTNEVEEQTVPKNGDATKSESTEVEVVNAEEQDTLTLKEGDQPIKKPNSDLENTKAEQEEEAADSRNLISIFILSFLGGFAALLTPCVFPMIPMTVSFFTKQSKTRASGIKNALLYGLFIIVIYVVLGSVVVAIFGADSLNALSTNVWFNLIFFGLLLVFAFSFLGAFEIVLPSSWVTKIDSQADRGGLIGIFFMALALAIVSFSCTGPIVGTLLGWQTCKPDLNCK